MKIGDDGIVIYDEKSRRLADEMVMAEARQVAQQKRDTEDCACKDGMFPRSPASRRRRNGGAEKEADHVPVQRNNLTPLHRSGE